MPRGRRTSRRCLLREICHREAASVLRSLLRQDDILGGSRHLPGVAFRARCRASKSPSMRGPLLPDSLRGSTVQMATTLKLPAYRTQPWHGRWLLAAHAVHAHRSR